MNKKDSKKREAENKLKIAFIYYSFSSFIRQDYEILSKHFDVIKVNYYRKIWDTFKILQAILKSDLSFSWFVGGHTFLAVLFSKIFRKKSIVVAGGGEVAPYMQSTLGWHKRIYMKFALKHADLVLPVSDIIKNEVLRWWVEPKRMEVIYNGIDTEKFEPNSENENLVMTVTFGSGRIKVKRLDIFVKAAAYLPKINFVILGLSESDMATLKSLNPPENIVFFKHISQEELISWYQKAKVICQLSSYESFGMALAEAMACECIPVVTDRGALPEVVGDTGFYVPYGDPKATAGAIKEALNSNKGKDARERIKMMFPRERRERELIEVIKEGLE